MTVIPHECPVCGAELITHKDASADDYEWSHYDCGAEIIRDESGKLFPDEDCGEALRIALDKLNTATPT